MGGEVLASPPGLDKEIKMNRNLKLIKKFIYGLVLATLILVAGLTGISALNIPGNYKLLVVKSGSMEPAIKTGSVVIVKPSSDYRKGDVVTFKDPKFPKTTVTHRLYEIKDNQGKISFLTKGDANHSPDTTEILQDQVLGKMLFAVPFVGYPVNFAKTMEGLIIMVIIPTVIIVYTELLNIKKEALRIIREKRKNLSLKEKAEKEVGEEVIAAEKGFRLLLSKIRIFKKW